MRDLLLAAFAGAPPAARATDCAGADRLPAVAAIEAAKDVTLCLLNNVRVGRGLQPFARQPQLDVAAASYSQLMVAGESGGAPSSGELLEDEELTHRVLAEAAAAARALREKLARVGQGAV